MSEKRLYHVATMEPNSNKVCSENTSLKTAVESAERITVGWKARAKSAYRWHMPSGVNVCVERAENAVNVELIAISVFENDTPDKLYDIRTFYNWEWEHFGYKDRGDFINRYVAKYDHEAYRHIVTAIFSDYSGYESVGTMRRYLETYLMSRPLEYYQVAWTDEARQALESKSATHQ